VIFDNSKIKRLVPEFDARIPFSQGAREIMDWVDRNPQAQVVDEKINSLYDKIISEHRWKEN
jgi:hypothetical protein